MPDHTARRNPARAGIMAAATAALLLLATSTASAKTVTIAAVNFRFLPASQTVNVGDVVRWTFAGDPHTATSGSPGALDGRFDSGIQDPGGSFQFTFNTAGTFPYFCQVHPEQMFGTIVVRAAGSPDPTVHATTKPTARPTPRPTARPTVRPTATPTPTPKPTPTPIPTPTPTPTPTPESSESAPSIPVASLTVRPSEALLETPLPSSVPTTPGPDAVAPTSAIDPAAIVAMLVAVLVGGGLILARRRRVG